ncbi:hypothetical protein [Bailinhaonella thermotolerans]|uniref:hypothetical protein n=1 Tax=Bailinhaonella thermotolerans TaxID=1070861 RepID=UPI00192A34D2|nr:hypothetical protein [Bailinhaonella thermotolerans]
MVAATEGRRRGLAFAGIVAGLAAVGLYLTMMPGEGQRASRTSAAVSAAPSPSAATTAPPTANSTPPTETDFDIYALLPMAKERFAKAAGVAHAFTVAYTTFRHDEDLAARIARFKAYTTDELGATLARDVSSAGAIEQERADQVVARGDARLKSIRDMADGSVVFVVVATQHVTSAKGTENRVEEYAVTVTEVGSEWRVHDIQPAAVGQEGDVQPSADQPAGQGGSVP